MCFVVTFYVNVKIIAFEMHVINVYVFVFVKVINLVDGCCYISFIFMFCFRAVLFNIERN